MWALAREDVVADTAVVELINTALDKLLFVSHRLTDEYSYIIFSPYLSTLVHHPASRCMYWATRWHHSTLFVASSSASSYVVPISFRSRLTTSIQFFLGRPGFLLYPLSSHFIALRGMESSILNTCPSHLNLLSLMMSSNFHNPVFFLISSFLTLSFRIIASSLLWNLWWAASSVFICVTGSGHDLVPGNWYNLIFTGRLMRLLFQMFATLSKTFDAFPILILHSLSQFLSLEMFLLR